MHGRPERPASRAYSAALLALRPERDGRVQGYTGVEVVEQRFGDCIVDSFFPAVGSPTSPIEAGYMANAWIRLRHPDYDELRRIVETVGRTIRVLAH